MNGYENDCSSSWSDLRSPLAMDTLDGRLVNGAVWGVSRMVLTLISCFLILSRLDVMLNIVLL